MKETEGVTGAERRGRWREHMEKRRGQGAGGGEREAEDGDEEKKDGQLAWKIRKLCWHERQTKCKKTMRQDVLGLRDLTKMNFAWLITALDRRKQTRESSTVSPSGKQSQAVVRVKNGNIPVSTS